MKSEYQSSENYFFVSFGIDKGGYLDMLNLPVNPTMAEAKKAELEYKKDIEKEIKTERKNLREKLSSCEITQEEFDSKCKDLETAENAKQAHLNKLKEKFNAEISKKRDLENRGLKDEDVAWLPMITPIRDLKCLVDLINTTRPQNMSEGHIPEKYRVIDQSGIMQHFESLKLENHDNAITESIHTLLEVTDYLNFLVYCKNDLLWNSLMKSSFMDCWSGQIETWIEELKSLYSTMDYRIGNKASQIKPGKNHDRSTALFPTLIKPFSMQIGELEEQELEDFIKTPERKGDIKFSDLEMQLFKMLFGMQNLNSPDQQESE